MNVIQCYALSNDSNDNKKDQLYERLQSIIAKWLGKDVTFLLGELNVEVEMDNMCYEDIMKRHGMTRRNKWEWRYLQIRRAEHQHSRT